MIEAYLWRGLGNLRFFIWQKLYQGTLSVPICCITNFDLLGVGTHFRAYLIGIKLYLVRRRVFLRLCFGQKSSKCGAFGPMLKTLMQEFVGF